MYGTGGTSPLTGSGAATAVGATGSGAAVGTLAATGFHALFIAVIAVTILVVGFVLVRIASFRTRPVRVTVSRTSSGGADDA